MLGGSRPEEQHSPVTLSSNIALQCRSILSLEVTITIQSGVAILAIMMALDSFPLEAPKGREKRRKGRKKNIRVAENIID